MKAINIIWDLDEGDSDYALPKEVEIPKEYADEDIDTISDYITDTVGWCHKGFELVD